MYTKYYNEYEKKAERIREEAHREISPVKKEETRPAAKTTGLRSDEILLGAIIFFLLREEKADMTLILALVFILLN